MSLHFLDLNPSLFLSVSLLPSVRERLDDT